MKAFTLAVIAAILFGTVPAHAGSRTPFKPAPPAPSAPHRGPAR